MTKFAAFGTKLLINGVSIAQARNFTGPGLGLDMLDVTTHDQTTAWEEQIPALLRSGELSMELLFDQANTQHALALSNLVGRLIDDFELRFKDTALTAWTFNAYVVSFEPSMAVDGELSGTLTIKISGAPTLTAHYSV